MAVATISASPSSQSRFIVAVTARAECSPRAPRIINPPRPASRNSSRRRPRSQRLVAAKRTGSDLLFFSLAATRPDEAHTDLSGHEEQSGALDRQTLLARSIAACAQRPASPSPSSAPNAFAAACNDFAVIRGPPTSRCTTRPMFTSTGISRPPLAIAATARAVYAPIPGRRSNSSCVVGSPPAACAASAARCSSSARRL